MNVNVDWGGYMPFQPSVSQPLDEVPRRAARAAFNELMAAKDERIAELADLLARNGIELSFTDEGLQKLNDWFRAEVQGDPETIRLLPYWYAVVNDLALFLGAVLISRAPNLHWVMFDKGRKARSYQRHVIMGFTKVPNPSYHFDVGLVLAVYGHQIVTGQEVERDMFVKWMASSVDKA